MQESSGHLCGQDKRVNAKALLTSLRGKCRTSQVTGLCHPLTPLHPGKEYVTCTFPHLWLADLQNQQPAHERHKLTWILTEQQHTASNGM